MRFTGERRLTWTQSTPHKTLGKKTSGIDILSRGSYLYDEVRFILQQELREPRNYFAILEAVAAGKTRLNEIKLATGDRRRYCLS